MAQFLCLKNIRTFLGTCTSVFGLKETDLFQASMLYDYTDFARVLHTLSRLSNCSKAKQSRPEVQGFPLSSTEQLILKRRAVPETSTTAHSNELSCSEDKSSSKTNKEVKESKMY